MTRMPHHKSRRTNFTPQRRINGWDLLERLIAQPHYFRRLSLLIVLVAIVIRPSTMHDLLPVASRL